MFPTIEEDQQPLVKENMPPREGPRRCVPLGSRPRRRSSGRRPARLARRAAEAGTTSPGVPRARSPLGFRMVSGEGKASSQRQRRRRRRRREAGRQGEGERRREGASERGRPDRQTGGRAGGQSEPPARLRSAPLAAERAEGRRREGRRGREGERESSYHHPKPASAFCPHFLFPPSSESRERQREREIETVRQTDRQPERAGGRRAEEQEQEEDYAGRVPSQVCNWGSGGGGVQGCESVCTVGGARGAQRERRSDRGGGRRGSGGPCPAELAAENVSRGASHAVSNGGRLRAPPRLLSPAAGRPRRRRRRKTDAPQSPSPGSDPRSRQTSTPVSGASSPP